jgi:flagellar motor switch protein FliN
MSSEHTLDMLTVAEQALASIALPPATDQRQSAARPVQWEDFGGSSPTAQTSNIRRPRNETLDLWIELGRAQIHRDEALELRAGAVVPLDNGAGNPVDLYVGRQLVGRGEMLVVDGNYAVRVSEIMSRCG